MRTCQIDNCERVHKARGLCKPHYDRLLRSGTTLETPIRHKEPNGTGGLLDTGYLHLHMPNHPLAGGSGFVLAHRVVLYDKLGPGLHACHWCGRSLRWTAGDGSITPDGVCTDHLDFCRTNNAPENLVPSCRSCNSKRRLKQCA